MAARTSPQRVVSGMSAPIAGEDLVLAHIKEDDRQTSQDLKYEHSSSGLPCCRIGTLRWAGLPARSARQRRQDFLIRRSETTFICGCNHDPRSLLDIPSPTTRSISRHSQAQHVPDQVHDARALCAFRDTMDVDAARAQRGSSGAGLVLGPSSDAALYRSGTRSSKFFKGQFQPARSRARSFR